MSSMSNLIYVNKNLWHTMIIQILFIIKHVHVHIQIIHEISFHVLIFCVLQNFLFLHLMFNNHKLYSYQDLTHLSSLNPSHIFHIFIISQYHTLGYTGAHCMRSYNFSIHIDHWTLTSHVQTHT